MHPLVEQIEKNQKNSVWVAIHNFTQKLEGMASKHNINLNMKMDKLEEILFDIANHKMKKSNVIKFSRRFREEVTRDPRNVERFKKEYKKTISSFVKNLKNLELRNLIDRNAIIKIAMFLSKMEIDD